MYISGQEIRSTRPLTRRIFKVVYEILTEDEQKRPS